MQKWLSIIGIGEDGLLGLSAVAQSLIHSADVLVGGVRHLAMVPSNTPERIVWATPISDTINKILQRKGQQICILASGDPLCYGIGVTLLRHIPLTEMTIIPAPSAFSLACARLGWAITEVETLSLCARPPSLLNAYLYPNARLLILSEGRSTPKTVAELLTQQGYGASSITVLEHLGGSQERLVTGVAVAWTPDLKLADLNVIAVDCRAEPSLQSNFRYPGLPDNAYHHDGQLTKREVRAVTLATLAPLPGELLWDVGAGCGSISIEWMRSHPRCRAIAIEKSRVALIANNATTLGTPMLQILEGTAPAILQNLPQPDAVFIGGGITAAKMVETCWSALKPGGRLVANVVTLEGEQTLFEWHQQVGGTFTRIGIQRAEPVGQFLGWRSLSTVTQWAVIKSA